MARSSVQAADVVYRCARCDLYLVEADLKLVKVREESFLQACPACGMAVERERSRVVRPFAGLLLGAFAWPFHKESLAAMGALALMGWIASVLLVGLGSMVAVGIAIMYLLAVARSTALGEDTAPHAVDWVNAGDLIAPSFRFFLTFFVAFFPVTMGMIGGAPVPLLALGLVAGLLYIPAGLIIAAHADGWLAPLNMIKAARIALRTGVDYLITSAAVLVLIPLAYGVFSLLNALRTSYAQVPFVFSLLFFFGWLILPMIIARMLGILVREHAHEFT
jgi:hypothetical protein